MKISEISGHIRNKTKAFSFEGITQLSNGQELAALARECFKLNAYPEVQNSKAKFNDYFKKSLAEGTCYGQILSVFNKRGDPKKIKSHEHILDTIRIQFIYECRIDMSRFLCKKTDNTTTPSSPKKKVVSKNALPTLSKPSDDDNSIHKARLELIKKIKAVEKKSFEHLRKDTTLVIKATVDPNEKSSIETYLDTEKLLPILEQDKDLYIYCGIESKQKNSTGHSVCIMKSHRGFTLYDGADEKCRVMRTAKTASKLLNFMQKNLSSAFPEGINFAKFKVYVNR